MSSSAGDFMSRLPREALFILFCKRVKSLFLIVWGFSWLLARYLKDFDFSFSYFLLFLVLLLFISSFLTSIDYFFTFYGIQGDSFHYKKGFLIKTELNVPISNIYLLRGVQGFWLQQFDMEILNVDTAGSSGDDISLILTVDASALLRESLVSRGGLQKKDEADKSSELKATEADSVFLFSVLDLVKAAFSKNHLKGVSLVLGTVWLFYGYAQQFFPDWINGLFTDFTENLKEGAQVMELSSWVFLFFLAYFASLLLSIVRVLLKYWEMKINFSADGLDYEAGLFSHSKVKIGYNKIASVRQRRNPLEKVLQLETVDIEQSHNVLDIKEEKRSCSSVIIGLQQRFETLNRIFSSLDADNFSEKVCADKSYFIRTLNFNVFLPLLLFLPLYFYFPQSLVLAALWLLVGGLYSYLRYRKLSVILGNEFLVLNSGAFSDIKTVLPIAQIEMCSLRQTFFQRRRGTASLLIFTEGLAEIRIPYIALSEALELRDRLLYLVERP